MAKTKTAINFDRNLKCNMGIFYNPMYYGCVKRFKFYHHFVDILICIILSNLDLKWIFVSDIMVKQFIRLLNYKTWYIVGLQALPGISSSKSSFTVFVVGFNLFFFLLKFIIKTSCKNSLKTDFIQLLLVVACYYFYDD